MRDEEHVVSQEEIREQYALMERARRLGGGKYHVVTYGCQMNVRDSQTLSGMLEGMGYQKTEDREEAELILFNTCCVRDNAERRVFGNVGHLLSQKKKNPNLIIGVCGCMMQQEGAAEKLLRQSPFVDLVFGTSNLYRFPELLLNALEGRRQVVEVEEGRHGLIAEGLPAQRGSGAQAFVNIMFGCNNFCTYCIVPYVRGQERSRSGKDIIKEVEGLAKSGVKEITLLGQNVNSYDPGGGYRFFTLLRDLDGLVPRIRFMTSHPKDLSEDLIEAMAQSKSVCPQLHLPVQSGSNDILRGMNRGYTKEHYLLLVQKLRLAMPNIGLTTDFIVGFPGETEEDFQDTMALDLQCRFDSAFTFVYSKRNGTKAAQMDHQVPDEIKRKRIQRLIAQQETLTAKSLEANVGKEFAVLIEDVSKRGEGYVMGKTDTGFTVNLPADGAAPGDMPRVQIQSFGANTLKGQKI